MVRHTVVPIFGRVRQDDQGHFQLHQEFKASLGYLRAYLKNKTKLRIESIFLRSC